MFDKDINLKFVCVCVWFKFSFYGDYKVNVGLNFKFNKKNEEVFGYIKKVGSEWMYLFVVE